MRSFPSAGPSTPARGRARRQLTTTAIAVALALALLTSPWSGTSASADNDKHHLEHQRDHVKHRIRDASSDLEDSSRAYRSATRRLTEAQRRLKGARAHVADVEHRLRGAKAHALDLRRQLDASKRRLATATRQLRDGEERTALQKEAVRDAVTNGVDPTTVRLEAYSSLFTAEDFSDTMSELSSSAIVADAGQSAYETLEQLEAQLRDRRGDVADATADVAQRRQAAIDHLVTVRDLYGKARSARAAVADLVSKSRTARRDALKARARDRQVLARLRKRENAIAAHIRRLAARDHRTGYTGRSNGFLDYPANGPVTSPFGYRVHPIYGYYSLHNGTDFGVPCGTPLHASASGTVISEYYDSVYGNRLYLNVGNVNGHNMTLVYNHMTSYVAHRGQHVQRGDVVGYSGTTGWSTGCHLHFIVMIDGTPVNPMQFL